MGRPGTNGVAGARYARDAGPGGAGGSVRHLRRGVPNLRLARRWPPRADRVRGPRAQCGQHDSSCKNTEGN
jgi:hypothetical protein